MSSDMSTTPLSAVCLLMLCLLMLSCCHSQRFHRRNTIDLFTSASDMLQLDAQEVALLDHLYDQILQKQRSLDLLTRRYHQLLSARPKQQDVEQYMGDPVNAFTLVRRLVREWPLVLNLVERPDRWQLPGEDAMQSALRGMVRLQQVYELRSQDIADNVLGSTDAAMTALDCFEMGTYLYDDKFFELSQTWFQQALQKVSKGDESIHRSTILPYYYLAGTFTGCQRSRQMPAEDLMRELITETPHQQISPRLTEDLHAALTRNCSTTADRWQVPSSRAMSSGDFELDIAYNRLCREGGRMSLKSAAALRCHYVHYGNPRLLVAPFKLEELQLDPPVLMFHEVISDQEIEQMKARFSDVMLSCLTLNYDDDPTGKTGTSNLYRTCNVGWVLNNASDTSARLSRRIADMTDLSVDTAETNQVACYGLAGEFRLHLDAFEHEVLSSDNDRGNRVATSMYYFNDVKMGGRTIFPHWDLAVTPRKGSALLWYNIDAHMNSMLTALHGGCPVLQGSKWIMNKWIRIGGQNPIKTCPVSGVHPEKYYYLNNN